MAFTGIGFIHGAAEPISKKIYKAHKNISIEREEGALLRDRDKNKFIRGLKKVQRSRFYGINFDNVEDGFKEIKKINTIEFRLPNGTVDADTWIDNINLFGGIMHTAQKLSDIQAKPRSELTNAEIQILEIFEKIKSADIDESLKLKYLLELVIPEENREIFEERYFVNKKLLKENKKISSLLDSFIAEGPVVLDNWRPTVSNIESYCYSQNNPFGKPVNGESLVYVTQLRLNNDLDKIKQKVNLGIDISE